MHLLFFALLFLHSAAEGYIKKTTSLVCNEHEIYTDCINPCQPTCQIPYPRDCPFLICHEGCICKQDFVRDPSTGTCIPRTSCGNRCIENQEYKNCGSACPPTCQRPDPVCIKICVAGCYCKEGFTFDAENERCVRRCDKCTSY